MTPIPVTLATGACATLLNFWLGWRIAQLRERFAVSVGDGGHEPLLRRMRAQANLVENAPFVLILIGGLEISGVSRFALASIAAIFILARLAHPIGCRGINALRPWSLGIGSGGRDPGGHRVRLRDPIYDRGQPRECHRDKL